jgi:hypothetical protein
MWLTRCAGGQASTDGVAAAASASVEAQLKAALEAQQAALLTERARVADLDTQARPV